MFEKWQKVECHIQAFVFWISLVVFTLTKQRKYFKSTNRINLQMFPAENTVHIELLFNLKNKSNISCDDVGRRFVQEFRLNEQSVIYIK